MYMKKLLLAIFILAIGLNTQASQELPDHMFKLSRITNGIDDHLSTSLGQAQLGLAAYMLAKGTSEYFPSGRRALAVTMVSVGTSYALRRRVEKFVKEENPQLSSFTNGMLAAGILAGVSYIAGNCNVQPNIFVEGIASATIFDAWSIAGGAIIERIISGRQ